jgi:hypothetical protein
MIFIDLFDAAREIQDFCDGRDWRSGFIGGIAVQRWGQARVTRESRSSKFCWHATPRATPILRSSPCGRGCSC